MPATRSNAFISSPPSRPQRLKEQEQGQHGSRAVEDICRVNLRAVSCDLTAEHVREDVHNSGRGYQPDDGCRDLPEHSSITSFRVSALILARSAGQTTGRRTASRLVGRPVWFLANWPDAVSVGLRLLDNPVARRTEQSNISRSLTAFPTCARLSPQKMSDGCQPSVSEAYDRSENKFRGFLPTISSPSYQR